MLRATRHQGDQYFPSNGCQCVANAVQALKRCYSICPSNWTQDTFDAIMEEGNHLYMTTSAPKYWSLEDIPRKIDGFSLTLSTPVTGNVARQVSDHDIFHSLADAITKVKESDTEGYVFTMGNSTPSYTSAIFLQDNTYYFIDTHSRSETGMFTPDGLGTVSSHKSLEELSQFIQNLAASIFKNEPNAMSEIAKLNVTENVDLESNPESEFSGFDLSEGEYSCRLYMVNERVNEIFSTTDTPEVSDVSSINSDSLLDSSMLDDAIAEVNDSGDFLQMLSLESINFTGDDEIQRKVDVNQNYLHEKSPISKYDYSSNVDSYDFMKEMSENDVDENVGIRNETEHIQRGGYDVPQMHLMKRNDDENDNDDVPLIHLLKRNDGGTDDDNGGGDCDTDDDDDDNVPLIYLRKGQDFAFCDQKAKEKVHQIEENFPGS